MTNANQNKQFPINWARSTVEEIVDDISNVSETGSGNDGVFGNAIAADGKRGDMRKVSWSKQGRVTPQLHKLPRANQNGSEFQNSEALSGSGRNSGLHVEERYFGSIFRHHRHFLRFFLSFLKYLFRAIETGCQFGVGMLLLYIYVYKYACKHMPNKIGKLTEEDRFWLFFKRETDTLPGREGEGEGIRVKYAHERRKRVVLLFYPCIRYYSFLVDEPIFTLNFLRLIRVSHV